MKYIVLEKIRQIHWFVLVVLLLCRTSVNGIIAVWLVLPSPHHTSSVAAAAAAAAVVVVIDDGVEAVDAFLYFHFSSLVSVQ